MEDEDIPAGILQRQHRLSQAAGLFPAENGGLRSGGGIGQGQLLVGRVGVAAPAAALPEPGVFADAAQPGVETAAAFKTVDVQKGLVKCLLQQLLRLVLVAGQRQKEPVDRLALGFVQVFKSGHGLASFPMMP